MANETKTTKKTDDAKASKTKESIKKEVSTKVKATKESTNFRDSLNSKNVEELRLELSKVKMDILAGKERNTSLIKMIKKEIAKKLSQQKAL